MGGVLTTRLRNRETGRRWALLGGGRVLEERGGAGRVLVEVGGTGGRVGGRGLRRSAPPPLSTARRLAPLYASARALWLLVALAALGLLVHFLPAALRASLLGPFRTLLPRA